jgi:hypothetical protein
MRVNPWKGPEEYRAYILGLDGHIELRIDLNRSQETRQMSG